MAFNNVILILIFLAFAGFGRLIFKNLVNPITFMCGIWAVIVGAYSFHAYDLYTASDKTMLLIALGITMFFVGDLVACGLSGGRLRNENTLVNPTSLKPDYKLLIIMNVLAIICFFGFFVSSIQLLRSGLGFSYIARYFGTEEGTIGASQHGYDLMEWYVWPLCLATAPLAAMTILLDKEASRDKTLFLITYVITLVMFVIVTGKRMNMICLIVYLIIVMLMQNVKIKLKRRTKVLLFLSAVVIIYAFNYISISRGTESIFRSIYIYFCGCIPCLSTKLENIPVGFQHGLISLHGLYRAPMILLTRILRSSSLLSIRAMFAQVINYTQQRVYIGSGVGFNAFVTPFFYFYSDFGVFGVVLFSFLFGFFCMRAYLKYLKEKTYRSLAVYLLVTYSIYLSMVRFQFVQMRYVLAFVYLLIPFYRSFRVRISFKKRNEFRPLR